MLRLRFPNIISHLKELQLLAEMDDSRSEAGNVQDEPGISDRPEIKELLRIIEIMLEDSRGNMKKIKMGTI